MFGIERMWHLAWLYFIPSFFSWGDASHQHMNLLTTHMWDYADAVEEELALSSAAGVIFVLFVFLFSKEESSTRKALPWCVSTYGSFILFTEPESTPSIQGLVFSQLMFLLFKRYSADPLHVELYVLVFIFLDMSFKPLKLPCSKKATFSSLFLSTFIYLNIINIKSTNSSKAVMFII